MLLPLQFPQETLKPTCDPYIFIEEIRLGYVRYRRVTDGRRWEVHGICDKRGYCVLGMNINGEKVSSLEEAKKLAEAYDGLDCPVTPEFKGCCPFTYNELSGVNNGN